jgi:plastocyanin
MPLMISSRLSTSGRFVLLPVLVLGVALLLAACGSGESNQSATTDGQTGSPHTAATTIEITMTDYGYEPSALTVPARRQVTLQFTNDGSVEHYFVVGDSITADQDGFRQNLLSGVSITKNKQTEEPGEESEEAREEEEGDHENVFELPPRGKWLYDVYASGLQRRHVCDCMLRDNRGQAPLPDGNGGHPHGHRAQAVGEPITDRSRAVTKQIPPPPIPISDFLIAVLTP